MRLYLLFLLSSFLVFSVPSMAAENTVLAIIAPPLQQAKPLTKSELALIFWRKKLFWSNGERILPVNFSTEHLLRNQFSKQVLNSLPETQTDYWNGLYYHGVSPPHVVNSSEAALRFVAETKGAIAYVPACSVDDRVKVLAWLNSEGQLLSISPNVDCDK